MQARAVAAQATREKVLGAAREQFLTRWFDEVTLQDIAGRAGVTTQTVINHFGSKEQLLVTLADGFSEEILGRRAVPAGDVAGAVAALVDDYEITGDPTIRMLALEGRMPSLTPLLDAGRRDHRAWVERTLGGGERLPALVVATDVYTWKLLRRDQGLDRPATVATVRRLVDGVLTTPDPSQERSG